MNYPPQLTTIKSRGDPLQAASDARLHHRRDRHPRRPEQYERYKQASPGAVEAGGGPGTRVVSATDGDPLRVYRTFVTIVALTRALVER
jgi:hypothetical protein